jgi:hypothetical protein
MSWSVSVTGTPQECKDILKEQFAYPLAEVPQGLPYEEEKETVRRVESLLDQCLDTFGPTRIVTISASGHMSFGNWETKANPYQVVNVSIGTGTRV